MTIEPEELWPTRPSAASDGPDEQRPAEEHELIPEDELSARVDEDMEWAIDADDRVVELDDEERPSDVTELEQPLGELDLDLDLLDIDEVLEEEEGEEED